METYPPIPTPPPTNITIGAHTVTIDSSAYTGSLLREEDRRGDSRVDQLLIRIDTQRPHTVAAETLLHECFHFAWHQSNIGLDRHEEDVISALAPRILELLCRNPHLVGYLTADPGDNR